MPFVKKKKNGQTLIEKKKKKELVELAISWHNKYIDSCFTDSMIH